MQGADLRYNLKVTFEQAATGDEDPPDPAQTCDLPPTAPAAVPLRAASPRPAPSATAPVRCAIPRASSRSPCPAPPARVPVRSSKSPAPAARARASWKNAARSWCASLPVWIPAPACVCAVKGTRRARRTSRRPVCGPACGAQQKYERQGQDLIYTCEISFVQAALGHRVEVPGLRARCPWTSPRASRAAPCCASRAKACPTPVAATAATCWWKSKS